MRNILLKAEKLFTEWNSEGIRYCHWKSNEHLYEGLVGDTDLDVLVNIDDRSVVENILIQLDYLKLNSQYGSRYLGVDDWVTCDNDTGRMVHIHLHYQMITGHKGLKEFDLPWTQEALNTRCMHEKFPVYVINPNLEIVILLSRIALKANYRKVLNARKGRYKLSADEIAEINYLKPQIEEENLNQIIKIYFSNDTNTFFKLIDEENRDAAWFCNLYTIVNRHLNGTNKVPYIILPFLRMYYFIILYGRIFLKKRTNFNPITRKTLDDGFMVAFIGQDGAGKSTVSDEVLQWLSWKMDAKKFYLGSGEHYYSWQKSLRSKIGKKNKIARAVSNFLTVSDLKKIARKTCNKIYKANKYIKKGGIAIFDRYPQLEYEGINDGLKIRRNAQAKRMNPLVRAYISISAMQEEKQLKKAVKVQPWLVFKMILPPEESIRRKPDESIQNVRQKHEIIKKLSFDESKVVVIDAAQDYDEEIKLIHNTIWEYILERSRQK